MYQYLDVILIILGGLIKNVEGKATIIGIISWGISKCPVGRPGIYTNVAKFSNWIEKIMSDTSTNGTTDTATTDAATTETTTTTTQITSNSTIQTTSSTTSPSNTITTDRTTISLMLFLNFFGKVYDVKILCKCCILCYFSFYCQFFILL